MFIFETKYLTCVCCEQAVPATHPPILRLDLNGGTLAVEWAKISEESAGGLLEGYMVQVINRPVIT